MRLPILCSLLACILAATAPAAELFVDATANPAVADGSAAKPFAAITLALDAAGPSGDTIIVLPGRYRERLLVRKNVTIRGALGPSRTIVEGSYSTGTIYMETDNIATIHGLAITGAGHGIEMSAYGVLFVRNCIIFQNAGNGIFLKRKYNNVYPEAALTNCVVKKNGGSGIHLNPIQADTLNLPHLALTNTILTQNAQGGLVSSVTGNASGGRATIDHNLAFDNGPDGTQNYGPAFVNQAIWGDIPIVFGTSNIGARDLGLDPLFLGDLANLDLRISPDSPCRDAGAGLDPDGSPADIGAFGGPDSEGFFTSPNDGPVIRSVVVDPGYVDSNGTFTIKAVGAVK